MAEEASRRYSALLLSFSRISTTPPHPTISPRPEDFTTLPTDLYPAGMDLSGNTFWEFRDSLASNRFRRIVKYRHAPHFADVKISPQWHQWLRHTRHDAPSLTEQAGDLQRISQIQVLAKLADERWASKPSFLDAPKRAQPSAETEVQDSGRDGAGRVSAVDMEGAGTGGKKDKDPWARARSSGPSEKWQPEAWDPSKSVR